MIKNKKLLSDYKNALSKSLGDRLEKVILFGSHVEGKPSEYSDYDILIIVKSNPDWKIKDKITDICYDIGLKYNILTDAFILSKSEINSLRGRQPIFQNALERGLTL